MRLFDTFFLLTLEAAETHLNPLITPFRTSLLPLALQAALDLNLPKEVLRRAMYWVSVVPE
jgi:hypothetical protein